MASRSIQGSTGYFLFGRRLKPLSAIAGAALLGAGLLAVAQQTAFIAAAAAQDQRPPSFADLAEKVRPAVVSVNVKSAGTAGETSSRDVPVPDLPEDFRDFFDRFKKGQPDRHPMRAQGSGFLISADGYVVTNHHVADKADEIEITFENEKKYKAKVIGSDQRTDIALLKIDSKDKFDHWLEFSDKQPRVGDWVLAVGNPFGLGGTVTAGIVSAQGRDIGSGPYDFLQIDAAVNRGNSGGPSVNLDGKVVGVNTAIYSPSGGSVGIAFAIPAATARDVVQKLKDKGKVSSGWLGVQIRESRRQPRRRAWPEGWQGRSHRENSGRRPRIQVRPQNAGRHYASQRQAGRQFPRVGPHDRRPEPRQRGAPAHLPQWPGTRCKLEAWRVSGYGEGCLHGRQQRRGFGQGD